MEPLISFKNFSFKYRTQVEPTLRDINLDIFPGEKVLIAGASGSGKSTLAQCINALIPCCYPGNISGTLTVAGLNPAEAGIFGMSKHVGTVLQDTDGQFIGLTVAEDIAFALENDMLPRNQMLDVVNKAASTVGITELMRMFPGALSGGQKQRVSMAGVLVDDVDILLFDEPLANLDPATGKSTIELIDRLRNEKKKTVIIIEHRLEDILWRSVDRIVLVSGGRIAADMKPDELLCTDILRNEGIREPLYIAALKQAGCKLMPESKPSDVQQMNLAPYLPAIKNWYGTVHLARDMNEENTVLDIEHLAFSYDAGGQKRKTLDDISFTVKRGEMLSIVGKNGAGKSTLSSLICGFFNPDSGKILLDGNDISRFSIKERGERIGLVMQNPNQMISKPLVFDEVALGLRVRNVSAEETERQVNEVLKLCGLYPFRHWPIGALSFGQKKRVTIASILVLKPEILILDEPTAGQDYRHYTDIMEFLKKIHEQEKITILMITHDMHLMLEYTDRAIVLADGKIVADGTPAAILTDESITKRAYLKKTSLYDLALRSQTGEPSLFVEKFIYSERKSQNGKADYL